MTRIKLIFWIFVGLLVISAQIHPQQPAWFVYSALAFIGIGFLVQIMLPEIYYKRLKEEKKTTKFAAWCSKIISK